MNFCPQCGKDIRKTTSDQPIESNDVISTQDEVTIPAWAETAAIVPGTAPIEGSEKQEETTTSWEEQLDCPTDARNSILKEKVETPEEPVLESSEDIQAEKEMAKEEPLPTTGKQIKETGESFQKQGKSKKWILAAALCIIAAIVAGVYLWPRNNSESSNPAESKVDISKIADSVLYLEVFDENNVLIGSASGFLVNDQSTLVTNYHVVQDAYHIVAKTADGAQATDVSCILAYDEIADLAILSCDSKVMAEPLTVGNSETVKQGDAVYAVGYPLGLANTLSDGIVSSRYIDEYDNDTIQVTAAISEGNSGGPLLDANGQVIGVMCAYYIYGQNLNIAVASDMLAGLLESEYEKTNLKYWKNRPAMPGEEPGTTEPQPEQEVNGDTGEISSKQPNDSESQKKPDNSESQKKPESPKETQPTPNLPANPPQIPSSSKPITLNHSYAFLKKGETINLTATLGSNYKELPITWSSTDANSVSVDSNGLVTVKQAGFGREMIICAIPGNEEGCLVMCAIMERSDEVVYQKGENGKIYIAFPNVISLENVIGSSDDIALWFSNFEYTNTYFYQTPTIDKAQHYKEEYEKLLLKNGYSREPNGVLKNSATQRSVSVSASDSTGACTISITIW